MLTPALEFPHSIRYSSLGDDSIATSYNLSESYKYKSLKVRLYRGLGIYEDRAPNRGLHKVIQRLVIPPREVKDDFTHCGLLVQFLDTTRAQ